MSSNEDIEDRVEYFSVFLWKPPCIPLYTRVRDCSVDTGSI